MTDRTIFNTPFHEESASVPVTLRDSTGAPVAGGGGGGDATAANQDTANTLLSAISTTLTTQSAYIDGLEALITATNAALTAATLPVGPGTAAAAGRVTHASDDPAVTSLQLIDDRVVKINATFTRPNDSTPYGINDAVADSTSAATKFSFAIPQSSGVVRRVRIRKSDQTVATPTLRLWLWDATFTVGAQDNAAFAGPFQDTLGFVDVSVVNAGSDDAVGWQNCDIPVTAATMYGLIQTLSAFTPAAQEVFNIDVWVYPG